MSSWSRSARTAPCRPTAQDRWRAEVIGEDDIDRGEIGYRPAVGGDQRVVHDGHSIVVFVNIDLQGDANLPQIAQAGGRAALLSRLAKRRQEKRRQHCDDGNNDEQFKESEGRRENSPKPIFAHWTPEPWSREPSLFFTCSYSYSYSYSTGHEGVGSKSKSKSRSKSKNKSEIH